MPLLTAPTLERNLVDEQRVAVDVPDSVSTTVIPDSISKNPEYSNIEIFNAGGNNAYYAYGRDCDNIKNFNAYIVPGQMLEVAVRQKVNIFSVGGTKIAITALKRRTEISNIKYPA